MEACRTLKGYAIYTDKIRKYAEKMSLEDAVERAICECIEEGILKEFLEKHRAEAKAMRIFEYDQGKHKIPNLYWRIRQRFDRMDTG